MRARKEFSQKTWSEALIIFNFHTSLLLAFLLHCGLSEKRKERWYLFGATKQHEFTARGSSIISHSLPFYNTYRVYGVSSSKCYTVTTRDCIECQVMEYIWRARTRTKGGGHHVLLFYLCLPLQDMVANVRGILPCMEKGINMTVSTM